MCGSTRTRSCSASPICRARRRPPRSTFALARPRAARDARPHALSADRRRPTSSRSRPTGSSGSSCAKSGPTAERGRTRPNSRHAGRSAMDGALLEGRSGGASSATCCPRFWRQRWFGDKGKPLHGAVGRHPARRGAIPGSCWRSSTQRAGRGGDYAAAADHQMDPVRRDRASAAQASSPPSPRRARRHAGRCLRRSGLHRVSAAQAPCRRHDRAATTRASSSARRRSPNRRRRRSEVRRDTRAVEHHRRSSTTSTS